MNGIILVNKEKDMSSHDVINRLRRILKTKKIGHCGTLDPLATGVLVCLVNNATKISNYLVLDSKEYIATFKLGFSTTTQDLAGEVVDEKKYQNNISEDKLIEILNEFKGKLIQTPSIYSAIKVNGKKLYEYARKNEEVEIPTREIEIFELELLQFIDDTIKIRVLCSSGTYIRTLCYDIAQRLEYPGVLTNLIRSKSGKYCLEQTATINDIEKGEYQIIPIENALDSYQALVLSDEKIVDVMNGKQVENSIDERFVVYDKKSKAIAIYDQAVDGYSKMLRGLW